jgi:hypothetical protein
VRGGNGRVRGGNGRVREVMGDKYLKIVGGK